MLPIEVEANEIDANEKEANEAEASETAPEAAAAAEAPVRGRLDAAPNGRARCRVCATGIAKGALRIGEIAPNQFAEGDTTYWFHAACAARRRPLVFRAALEGGAADEPAAEVPAAAQLVEEVRIAERGAAHPRLARLTALERAASGRARCRHCRENIEKGQWRCVLTIFNAGRFDPIGFCHLSCVHDYVGSRVTTADVQHLAGALSETDQQELGAQLA